jgi:6-phosphogluconolactonase/glucosamine-6-phosphate isomerase/deaminase
MFHLKSFPDTATLISRLLALFTQLFPTLGKNDGIMLSGGKSPLEIYRRAAETGLSTTGTLFLSDERCVPVTDPQSNYGTISPFFCNTGQAGYLSRFMKVNTGLPIEAAAQAFHNDLSKLERIPLGLLGLGTDGHTASLFNLQDAALRDERLAIPVMVNQRGSSVPPAHPNERDARSTFINQRISVTPALLLRIEKILILAAGAEKKEIIRTLLGKPGTIPAGLALADHPDVEIWTDQTLQNSGTATGI